MSAFLTIAVIHFLALISPGPDFIFITKQSIAHSRKTATFSALGIALANLVHVAYCIIGIGVVISQSILVFNSIKYIGAIYLIYIGWKSIRYAHKSFGESVSAEKAPDISFLKAVLQGFACNVLNPKCTLFFLALFTQVIDPSTPLLTLWMYGLWIALVSFVWFAFLASLFSLAKVRAVIGGIQHHMERAMGAILIALGIKVLFSSRE